MVVSTTSIFSTLVLGVNKYIGVQQFMATDFLKAVIYKLLVDVPILLLLPWLWFGHPGQNIWFVGVTTVIGTILLYYFEQYWAIKDRWGRALPVSLFWFVLVVSMFYYLSVQN